MLRPRKNPLVDGPLVVTPQRHLRVWRWAAVGLAAIIVAGFFLWPRADTAPGVSNEVWWRQLISSLAFRHITQSVNLSAHEELKQRLAQVEAERQSLSERLADAERVMREDRSERRLRQVVARRKGNELAYEILLRNPEGSAPGILLMVEVAGINLPDPGPGGLQPPTYTLPIGQVRKLEVPAPKVAETLQGRLTSGASHLLVVVRPQNGVGLSEALVVPVTGATP